MNGFDAALPSGELVIQTVAMPSATNFDGDIFGGWLVSQMDMGAGMVAVKRSQKRAVTVAIDAVQLKKPVKMGDIVCCYGKLLEVGRTSMKIQVEIWAIHKFQVQHQKVAEGLFTFVSVDHNGLPVPVDS